ncbi:hypothetical protein BT63DRAFT_421610 [Microthyrium microscopicum]|uniref:Uncharacterized protein n=1 Tax=Microthyrium microscopicum TaxID=703497 RepID=A0A6A6UPU0_9PEZI|nr:hypothetical protein BT63DRAFT_421610 [Microthyrium microscopicum]
MKLSLLALPSLTPLITSTPLPQPNHSTFPGYTDIVAIPPKVPNQGLINGTYPVRMHCTKPVHNSSRGPTLWRDPPMTAYCCDAIRLPGLKFTGDYEGCGVVDRAVYILDSHKAFRECCVAQGRDMANATYQADQQNAYPPLSYMDHLEHLRTWGW